MCFIIGQLISAGVMAGMVNNTTQWSYGVPFALQWFWPVLLIPFLCFAPDTPWHLIRKDRPEAARGPSAGSDPGLGMKKSKNACDDHPHQQRGAGALCGNIVVGLFQGL
jgi:hypothetical protein